MRNPVVVEVEAITIDALGRTKMEPEVLPSPRGITHCITQLNKTLTSWHYVGASGAWESAASMFQRWCGCLT